MASRDADRLTPPPTTRPATLAQHMRRELSQSVSDRPDPTRRSDEPAGPHSQITSTPITHTTPVMPEDNLRRLVDDFVHSVQHDIASLRAQHITRRKTVKLNKPVSATVPLLDSDVSRSASPALITSPSLVMQRARTSGQFSTADLQLVQDAFDAAASMSIPREQPRSMAREFSLKLYPYDGTSEPFETFIARFENFSDHFQWSEQERLFNLRNSLAKSVGNVLWDSGSPSSSAELIQLLRSRYGTEHQAERFRMELKTRRRQKDEPLQSVFQDIKRLMALAFPGQHGSMAEITAIDAFVDSFTNRDLRKQVLQKSPATLAEALTWAVHLEAIDDSGKQHTSSYDKDGHRDKDNRRGHRAYAQVASSTSTSTHSQPAAPHSPEKRRSSFQTRARSVPPPRRRIDRVGSPPRHSHRAAPASHAVVSDTSSRHPLRCFNCEGIGHFQHECPSPHKQSAVHRSDKSDWRRSDKPPASAPTTPSAPAQPAPQPSTPSREQGHANIVSWKRSTPETYIEIDIAGFKQACLLDTGCDYSLIPSRLVPQARLTPVNIDIYAANGSPVHILGRMTVRFHVSGIPIIADLLVSEDIHEFLLGYDWLVAQGAHWFFDRKILLLHGKEIPLQFRTSRSSVSRIYAKEQVIVNPCSTQAVPVKIVRSSLRIPKADWLLEQQTLATGVHVDRALLPDSSCIAVRVVNQTTQPFTLEAGTEVGQASLATVDKDVVDLDTVAVRDSSNISNAVSVRTITSESQEDFTHLQPVLDTLPTELTPLEREEAITFIKGYSDVFSKGEFDLGRTSLITHHIDTGDAKPIRQPLRRHPQVYLDIIDTEISKMEAARVIEPSYSPWASNVVVVRKHDSTPRITLDYRQLNSVTYKDSYPLPNIADCLDAFRGASYFAVLDLRSSFYQVPLAEEDRDKTAFITRKGQWRFRSLPMGLSNSPGTFQRLMDMVLRGLTWTSVLVYIDDIVVYASSHVELRNRLAAVFQRLRDANLKLKPSKVRLFQRQIKFLGNIVSGQGVAVDDSKVIEITQWAVPRNVHEIRSFLGICSYYRRYVKDFAAHAAPLHELTKKDNPYTWDDQKQASFDFLKNALTTAPILAMSRDEGTYVLDVDASDRAMGAVLQQEQEGMLRVIGYSSRIFNTCEIKYCITRKELAAIIFGLKQYRQYLLGRRFTIRSDHAALLYLRSAKELIGQQARWLDFIEEFNFDLQHRAGVSHGNADALSRKYSSSDQNATQSCIQCRKRGMVREDNGDTVDACQDAKRPRESVRTDSPPRGFVHAVQTRAQKRRKQDHSPDVSDRDINSDSDEISSTPVQRGKRHRHRDAAVNQSMGHGLLLCPETGGRYGLSVGKILAQYIHTARLEYYPGGKPQVEGLSQAI